MAIGTIKKLAHLSQQTYLPNTQLVPDRNDKGYGVIEGEDAQEVYFHHKVVENWRGFDDLRRGQMVEYVLKRAPDLQASFVRLVPSISANVDRPAA